MADPEDKHYFGFNRPEQTGEGDSHGFRTSAHADAAPALATLDPTGATFTYHARNSISNNQVFHGILRSRLEDGESLVTAGSETPRRKSVGKFY